MSAPDPSETQSPCDIDREVVMVKVRFLTGVTVELEVPRNLAICDFQTLAADAGGLSADQNLRLIYKSKYLDGEKCLNDYGVECGDVIHGVPRAPPAAGGPSNPPRPTVDQSSPTNPFAGLLFGQMDVNASDGSTWRTGDTSTMPPEVINMLSPFLNAIGAMAGTPAATDTSTGSHPQSSSPQNPQSQSQASTPRAPSMAQALQSLFAAVSQPQRTPESRGDFPWDSIHAVERASVEEFNGSVHRQSAGHVAFARALNRVVLPAVSLLAMRISNNDRRCPQLVNALASLFSALQEGFVSRDGSIETRIANDIGRLRNVAMGEQIPNTTCAEPVRPVTTEAVRVAPETSQLENALEGMPEDFQVQFRQYLFNPSADRTQTAIPRPLSAAYVQGDRNANRRGGGSEHTFSSFLNVLWHTALVESSLTSRSSNAVPLNVADAIYSQLCADAPALVRRVECFDRVPFHRLPNLARVCNQE